MQILTYKVKQKKPVLLYKQIKTIFIIFMIMQYTKIITNNSYIITDKIVQQRKEKSSIVKKQNK